MNTPGGSPTEARVSPLAAPQSLSAARWYRLLESSRANPPDVIYGDAHYRSLKEIFSYSEFKKKKKSYALIMLMA